MYTETSIHWLIDINFLDVTYTDLYDDASTNVSSENDMCAFQTPFLFVYTEPSKKIYIREHL